MKGFGVFSPSNLTSRYLLVASGLNESSGNGTPRADASPVSLNLVDFKVTEKLERASDPYSDNYDDTTNFNQYSTDTPFSFSGANFDDYMNTKSNNGIGEFTLLHSVPFNLTNGYLTTMKWLKLGPPYENEKTLLSVGTNLGDVIFYDADSFVEDQSLVSTFTSNVCNVPVKCLGYCGKNMLGVAGVDGQISVVDLTDEANVNVVDVSYGKWKVGLVTSLSWNYRLSHILASSGAALVPSDTSGVVVWDLKVRKPASTFRDPSGRVNPIALDWVPDQPTQLVVGYADDNSPSLQLWDLRNCSSPLTEVKAHTRGLTDLKFSPHDPNMLLTCSKDDTTKCWQLTPERNFSLLSSLQTEALSHHSRVEWHLNAPGMFLSQANDGELCVHHAFSGKVEDSYMPLWTRKKGGIVTGFAGQVITWTATDVNNYTLASHYDSGTEELLESTLEVLSGLHEEPMFTEFCDSKVESSTNEYDRLMWSVLKSQYRGEVRDLLDVLGYPDPDHGVSDSSDLEDSDNSVGATNVQLVGLDTDEANNVPGSNNFFSNRSSILSEHTSQDDKDAEDFFNSLTLKPNPLDLTSSAEPEKTVQEPEEISDVFGVDQSRDDEYDNQCRLNWCSDLSLRRSLVKADHYGAAERCLRLNKVVECLLLAHLGGESVFMEMAHKVLRTKKDPFLNLLFMVMHNDVEGFLEYSNLRDWKETLCVLYTYSSDTSYFKELAHRFGRRLQANIMHQESSICFILSGDYREVVEAWRNCASEATSANDQSGYGVMGESRSVSSTLEERLEMLLKLSVLSFSTCGADYSSDNEEGYEHFDAVLMELAEVFVDAGNLEKALETLNVKGASNSEVMLQLKSKIENQILQSAGGDEQSSLKLAYHHSALEPVPFHVDPAFSHHAPHQSMTPVHQPPGTPVYPGTAATQPYGANPRTGYHPATSSYSAVTASATPLSYQHAGLNTAPTISLNQPMTSAPTRTVPLTAIQSASQSSVPSAHTATTTVPTSYATSNATQYTSQPGSTNFTPYSLSHSSSNTSYGVTQQAYASGVAAQQQGAQAYGAVSSAPGAVAAALNPGMPIPWPNPTPTQQMSSTTVSTQQSNKLIIESTQQQPKGEKMGKSDLDMVVGTLQSLLSNLGESKMDLDNKKNLNELINSLNQGLLSSEANSLLATLCRAVSNGDHFNSNVILGNIISKLWNNQNKPWIMCLKRLVPK